MDRGRWDQINTLLNAAMALPPAQRDAYLKRECGKDTNLLSEVHSLLQAQQDARSFLEQPANEFAATLIEREKPSNDTLVGQEIEGYRILGVLGQGGMGIVYKAHNITLDRAEALKVIAPTLLSDDQFLRRFRLEARALAKTHHPNIVTVYTLQENRLGHYITMEFVEGHTIADLLASQNAIPWRQALPIIKQLLAAFAYAHQRGIIHRDIKPRNIMLTPEGVVKVMDFGLAKFYQRNDVTMTQGVSGTPYYMSPEQIRGASNLDQRSDIFSLGMTLYEMLSGRLPFDRDGSLFNIQRAIIEDSFPQPHHLNAAVPDRLSAIIMTALEKEPADRYQYAGEMLEAIRAFEEDTVTVVPKARDETVDLPPVRDRKPARSRQSPAERQDATDKAPLYRQVALLAAILLLTAGLVWGGIALGPSLFSSSADDGLAETLTNDAPGNDAPQDNPSGTTDDPATQDNPSNLPEPTPDTDTRSAANTDTRSGGTTPAENSPSRSTPATTPATTPAVPPRSDPPENRTTTPAGSNGSAENAAQNAQNPTDTDPAATDPTATDATTEDAATSNDAPAQPPAAPEVSPAQLVEQEATALRTRLKTAIENDSWSGVPGPISRYYQDKIRGLPSKFSVQRVDVVPDFSGLQDTGAEMILPITVYFTIQQKGRDGTQALPIPSTWSWKEVNGRMTLVNVDDSR